MQLFLGKFNVKLLTNHIFVCYNNSIERKGCCTMYTTIQEAHEIFRGISENKMFFILEEIGGKVMMGTAMMYKYIGFLRTDARGITLRPHQVLTGDARMWSLANPVRVSNHSLTIKQLMDRRIVVYETSIKYSGDIVVLEANNFNKSDKSEFTTWANHRISKLMESGRNDEEVNDLRSLTVALQQVKQVDMSLEDILSIIQEV